MELRQLEHFVALAEEGSFTRAAKRMHIAQSGLSMSIRALEDELGTRLFTRGGKRVALTPPAESMLPEARRAIASVRAARDAVVATEALRRGSLAVGLAPYSHGEHLPNLLARFHADYPGVNLQARQGRTSLLMSELDSGRVDLALCGKPHEVPRSVTTVQLARLPYAMICATNHRLASHKRVTLADIAAEPFIEMNRGWVTRDVTDQAFGAAGLQRNVVCEVDDIYLRTRMVEAGLGVAIMPRIRIPGVQSIAYVALATPLADWQLVAAFAGAEPANPAARVFLRMAVREWGKG